MKTWRNLRAVLAGVVLLASGVTQAVADHIPGHGNNDPTHPIPFPGEDIFHGGAIALAGVGPAEGAEILHTTFDITWVSDGAMPASNLDIAVSTQVDGTFKEFHFTGADLGFGSGAGTFTGRIETDELNGVAWKGFFFDFSIVDIHVMAVDGGIDGYSYFVDSFVTFDVIPVPEPGLAGVFLGLAGAALRRRKCR